MNKSERTAVLTAIKTSSAMQALYKQLHDDCKVNYALGEVSALTKLCKQFGVDYTQAVESGTLAGEEMFRNGEYAIHS